MPRGLCAAALWAVFMLPLAGCATVEQQQAATMGGIQGAAVGAAVGAAGHHPVEGAAVGAAVGAATGAILASPQLGPQPPMFSQGN
jgi:Glycine zipper